MTVTVTLSANAGIAIEIGTRRIWIDALHDRRSPPFSCVSPEIYARMLHSDAFSSPDYICYTHCHPDHYSEELTTQAAARWPNAVILAPEGKFGGFSGEEICVDDHGLQIRFVRLPHEGAQYANVLHYGLIISYDGYQILIPGDAAVACEEILDAVRQLPIHLMILDFPWITLGKGRAFLQDHFPDAQLIACHIPFAQDDRFGYRTAVQRQAVKRENVQLLMEPLQSVTMEI